MSNVHVVELDLVIHVNIVVTTTTITTTPSRDKLGLRAQDVRARAGTISGFGSRKHSAN